MKHKVLALIPARGGSKRIPRKNIKFFFGKPLIAYSIETALQSEIFDKVVVSTDDKEIAQIATLYGAEIPFLRPEELANDFTNTDDVIQHAIESLRKQGEIFDFCCTIYATSPLLQKKFLIEAFNALKNSQAKYAFAACSMPFPIQRCFKIDKNNRCEMFFPENYNKRSQDLEKAYQDAGQFYFENLNYHSNENHFGKDSIPIVLPRFLVQDLDTPEDWDNLEILYKLLHTKK